MNFKKSFLCLCLIGIVDSQANSALSQGVDGNGPFKSAIPTPLQTLKVSVGGLFSQGKNVGIAKENIFDASGSPIAEDKTGSFSRTDMSFSMNYGITGWLEGSIFLPYYTDKTANGSVSKTGDAIVGLKFNYPPYGNPGKRAYELSYLGQLVIPSASATNASFDGIVRDAWNVRNIDTGTAYINPYNSTSPIIIMSLLNTINFKAVKGSVPLLIHYSGGLAMETGKNDHQTTVLGSLGLEFWTGAVGLFAMGETQVPTSHAEKGVPFQKYPASLKIGGMTKIPTNRVNIDISGGLSLLVNNKSQSYYSIEPAGKPYTYSISRQPTMAFFGGASIAFDFAARDTDHDGVTDAEDKCADTPDGVSIDSDGCPVPDNDRDGICDDWVGAKGLFAQYAGICKLSDKCPGEAEDMDKNEDEDGCPDPDNDGDKLCDPWVSEKGLSAQYDKICSTADKCPGEAEDLDGFEDTDGCPDLDNDKDGITDNLDQCSNEAEDKDNFQDDDGCPDPDNDKDGITDNLDKCPNKQGKAANNGCP